MECILLWETKFWIHSLFKALLFNLDIFISFQHYWLLLYFRMKKVLIWTMIFVVVIAYKIHLIQTYRQSCIIGNFRPSINYWRRQTHWIFIVFVSYFLLSFDWLLYCFSLEISPIALMFTYALQRNVFIYWQVLISPKPKKYIFYFVDW